MSQPTGRTALVTGADDGIRKGIARRFAAEGAQVIIAKFDAASGAAWAAEIVDGGGHSNAVAWAPDPDE